MEIEAVNKMQGSESYIQNPESYIYLYCFFKGPSSLLPQRGIDRINTTFVLSYKDLCALVSPVGINEYNEQALSRLVENLQWLAPIAKRHEEIIRYVMGFHPVIPIKLGTIYVNSERLMEILRGSHDKLCSYLDFVNDKEEWGIKVYAGKDAGRKKIEGSIELIGQLDAKITSVTPGQAYLLKKKRGNLIHQHSIDFLNHIAGIIYQQILPWAVEGRRNKILSKQATGKESNMILNAAFLFNKLDVEAFKEQINDLAAGYIDDGLSFEINGPWPCYNFCSKLAELT